VFFAAPLHALPKLAPRRNETGWRLTAREDTPFVHDRVPIAVRRSCTYVVRFQSTAYCPKTRKKAKNRLDGRLKKKKKVAPVIPKHILIARCILLFSRTPLASRTTLPLRMDGLLATVFSTLTYRELRAVPLALPPATAHCLPCAPRHASPHYTTRASLAFYLPVRAYPSLAPRATTFGHRLRSRHLILRVTSPLRHGMAWTGCKCFAPRRERCALVWMTPKHYLAKSKTHTRRDLTYLVLSRSL